MATLKEGPAELEDVHTSRWGWRAPPPPDQWPGRMRTVALTAESNTQIAVSFSCICIGRTSLAKASARLLHTHFPFLAGLVPVTSANAVTSRSRLRGSWRLHAWVHRQTGGVQAVVSFAVSRTSSRTRAACCSTSEPSPSEHHCIRTDCACGIPLPSCLRFYSTVISDWSANWLTPFSPSIAVRMSVGVSECSRMENWMMPGFSVQQALPLGS
jgi:hypothetical protein